jgi:hypothetical protein
VCPKIRKRQLRTGRLLDELVERCIGKETPGTPQPQLQSTTFYFSTKDKLAYEEEIRKRKVEEGRVMRELQPPASDIQPPASLLPHSYDTESQRKRNFGQYLKDSDELRVQIEVREYQHRKEEELHKQRVVVEEEKRRIEEENQSRRASVLRR